MSDIDDRSAIIEVCARLAWYADQRQWELLPEVFADKVVLDFTSLSGGAPATMTPEQIGAAWSGVLGGLDATQHLLTNHLVSTDGDSAVCTCGFQATHRLDSALGSPLWTLGGTYHFDLVRTGDRWKISGMRVTAIWADGNRDVMTRAAASS